jgi:hypothetical protein
MKTHTSLASLLFLMLSIVSFSVYSQVDRSCSSIAVDPDGDGFGWEWNYDSDALGSCVVTDESAGMPSLVNEETGEQVQLIRPYWNANRDLAGRTIECKGYDLDRDTGAYANRFNSFDSILYHQPLPTSPPYTAYAEYDKLPYLIWPDDVMYKVWTVVDGRYIGPLLGRDEPARNWLEIIEATESTPAGIRIWGGTRTPAYRECFDQSGADFGPTGYIGEELPNSEPETESLIVTGQPAPALAEPLVNLETSVAVPLTTAHWDLYQSFWERTIHCWPSVWNGSEYYPEYYNSVWNSFFSASTGEQRGLVGTRFGMGGGDGGTNDEWRLVDGALGVTGDWAITIHDEVEVIPATGDVPGHIRSWHSSESYTTCRDSGGLVGPFSTSSRRDLIPLDPDTLDVQQPDAPTSENGDAVADESESAANTGGSGGGAVPMSLLLILMIVRAARGRNRGVTVAKQ